MDHKFFTDCIAAYIKQCEIFEKVDDYDPQKYYLIERNEDGQYVVSDNDNAQDILENWIEFDGLLVEGRDDEPFEENINMSKEENKECKRLYDLRHEYMIKQDTKVNSFDELIELMKTFHPLWLKETAEYVLSGHDFARCHPPSFVV